jgi:hypothetical protein
MTINKNMKALLIIALIAVVVFLQYAWDLSSYFQPDHIRT